MADKETEIDHWPDGVRPITWNAIGKLGFHEDTGKLYWDGNEIITKSVVQLGKNETLIAWIVAIATVGLLITSVIDLVIN